LSTATLISTARLLEERQLSPVELIEMTLNRISQLNPKLSAYTTVTAEYARKRARQAEAEIARDEYRGPLHGIPYGLKDLIDTKDIRTTYGYRSHADYIPTRSATVHARLEEGGAILVGKLDCHLNRGVPVKCHNPWDLSRSPGWSSSGSGASLAASMCLASIGSDTAGSIRIPSAWSGVVGLKPSRGLISRHNAFAPCWSTDTLGPMAKEVQDVAVVLQAIAGYDPKDPTSLPEPVPDYRAHIGDGARAVRIGLVDELLGKECTEEVESAVRAAVDVLAELGAEVKEVSLPSEREGQEALTIIQRIECGVNYRQYFGAERLEQLDADVKEWLQLTRGYTMEQYLNAQRTAAVLLQEVSSLLNDVDVIVSPTCLTPALDPTLVTPLATLAPFQEGSGTIHVRGLEVNARPLVTRSTGLGSLTGLPCLSLPCGFTGKSLPIGLQLMGRRQDEALLLRVGFAYERATDWHLRRPPMCST
jgi:aspartyl-tRNA(Asn)/glutamyl-tRNA(Gln) amidotransferase subunit A